jgi:hypothetical protein
LLFFMFLFCFEFVSVFFVRWTKLNNSWVTTKMESINYKIFKTM